MIRMLTKGDIRIPKNCDNCALECDCERPEWIKNRGCEDWTPKSAFVTYSIKKRWKI